MDLVKLLDNLRKKLIEARQKQDRKTLAELATVFTVVEEAIGIEHKELSIIVSDMGFAARDSLMKTDWKSSILTKEDIERAISA